MRNPRERGGLSPELFNDALYRLSGAIKDIDQACEGPEQRKIEREEALKAEAFQETVAAAQLQSIPASEELVAYAAAQDKTAMVPRSPEVEDQARRVADAELALGLAYQKAKR